MHMIAEAKKKKIITGDKICLHEYVAGHVAKGTILRDIIYYVC